MIKICGMSRDLTDSYKLQTPSIPEIKDAFDGAAKQIARGVAFRGRKLRPGPLLNAVVLHFLSLDEAERVRIAVENLAILETLLEHEEAQDELLGSLVADAAKRRAAVTVEPAGGRIVDVKADRKRAKKLDRPSGE